ncbi:hypothetical protein P7K49_012897 [Saguinus oedipus]|uniref:Uncharacterized protein n=1 Tax=Saguinus oedipus TaxID=9490 RepID=A0ABQ9VEC6_SAGOE|nr:hypothetical protein P7K49_012897 [Saguinus oedipus]
MSQAPVHSFTTDEERLRQTPAPSVRRQHTAQLWLVPSLLPGWQNEDFPETSTLSHHLRILMSICACACAVDTRGRLLLGGILSMRAALTPGMDMLSQQERTTCLQEDPHQEDPHQEDPHQEDPHQEDPHQEDPHQEDPHQEDPHQEDPHQEDPHQEDPHQEDPHQEDPHQEDPHQEDPHQEDPHQEDPHQEDPLQGSCHFPQGRAGRDLLRPLPRGLSAGTGKEGKGQFTLTTSVDECTKTSVFS